MRDVILALIAVAAIGFCAPPATAQECYQSVQRFSAPGKYFGRGMAVENDRLVVSVERAVGTYPRGYVYERVNGIWVQRAALVRNDFWLNNFQNVALHGDLIVTGSPQTYTLGSYESGAAVIFRRQSPTSWTFEAQLFAEAPYFGHHFGESVAINADRIAVGAPYLERLATKPGEAYVFRLSEGEWKLEQKIFGAENSVNGRFGFSMIFIDDDLYISAPDINIRGAGSGAVYVYRRHDSQWKLIEQISADNSVGDVNRFGYSMAHDEGTLVISSPFDSERDDKGGAIYVFRRDEDHWVQVQKLFAPDGDRNDQIGESVSIQGSQLIAGTPYDDGVISNSGCVHLFEFDGTNWNYSAKIRPADVTPMYSRFGAKTALSGPDLLVSNWYDSEFGQSAGKVHVFRVTPVVPADCDNDGIPDACDFNYDCNNNGVPDDCDIAAGFGDCDGDMFLDICEIAAGALDCNQNMVPDWCDLVFGTSTDCNTNEIPDECDIATGITSDCNGNGLADFCEVHDYRIDDWSRFYEDSVQLHADAVWLNHFVVQPGREWINQIAMPFVTNVEAISLLIYDDPTNDGDPRDAVLLRRIDVVPSTEYTWHYYYTTPTYVGEAGESFFVGVMATVDTPNEIYFYLQINVQPKSHSESWVGAAPPGTVDLKNLTGFTLLPLLPVDASGQPWDIGVWVIRADATHYEGVPIDCMCPGDLTVGNKFGSDGVIDVADVMELITNWGNCDAPCAPFCVGDINSPHGLPDCRVDVFDLFALLSAWGACN